MANAGITSHRPTSDSLYDRACQLFPGGVNSPVRAFKAVGGKPVFLHSGSGAHVQDVDGNRYLDFVGSWGPLIFGHADPDIIAGIVAAASSGTTFGASTMREIDLAERIRLAVPSLEKMRFVSSGTEATMSALRVARGYTGRNKIVKIDGGYHGHADTLLAAAGSGALTLGIPGSAGVTAASVADTLVVPFNDIGAMEAVFAAEANRDQIAAVIVEPIPGNMGLVLPRPAYLPRLRTLCDQHGALLIFDEVISGFRVARGGAQHLYGVRPDMTCLGKVIGGGLPFGVYGGRAAVMGVVAPDGPVYQAGTLSGNPLAVAAGIATLKKLDDAAFRQLEMLGGMMEDSISRVIRRSGVKARIQRVGSAFTIFFTDLEVTDLASARLADTARFAKFFHAMLDRGFYLPPAQLEAAFISLAHTVDDIQSFAVAAKEVLAEL
jgi:glutamate-1-semialdehyde 2,1-aminomutase